jgi:PhoH-like ATPase
MRIKARALGLPAEDYFNDQVLEDRDLMYSGVMSLPADFWPKHGKDMESWADSKSGTMFYRVTGPSVPSMLINQFVYQENPDGSTPFYALVKEINGKTALLQTLRDFSHQKNNVWSVTARNREQNFAMNLLMNPDVDFVTLLGQAGTGKTLMAVAAGLYLTGQHEYNGMTVSRPVVAMGDTLGFLPGTLNEKLHPWLQSIYDAFEVLLPLHPQRAEGAHAQHASERKKQKKQMAQQQEQNGNGGNGQTPLKPYEQLIQRGLLEIEALCYIRGRSIPNRFFVLDEAQQLTPLEAKTVVTRMSKGSKLVMVGDPAQIDNPYVDRRSNGLVHTRNKLRGQKLTAHISLTKGERSPLAEMGATLM